MSEGRLQDYLAHLGQAATEALGFTEGLTREEFLADLRTQKAVVMCLVIIGEAASKVMDRHPEFANATSQCRGEACEECAIE